MRDKSRHVADGGRADFGGSLQDIQAVTISRLQSLREKSAGVCNSVDRSGRDLRPVTRRGCECFGRVMPPERGSYKASLPWLHHIGHMLAIRRRQADADTQIGYLGVRIVPAVKFRDRL